MIDNHELEFISVTVCLPPDSPSSAAAARMDEKVDEDKMGSGSGQTDNEADVGLEDGEPDYDVLGRRSLKVKDIAS
jgi:hypothetical protein